jgi:general nucleoside transport system ATP-binding protein
VTGSPSELALRMSGVTKRFGDVVANDDVGLDLRRGEVLGLLGENGAGKSTLMNVLYGLLRPDAGRIEVHGREVEIASPADALGHGIGMVHQHFMLIPAFSVVENLVLGAEPVRRGVVERVRARDAVLEIAGRFGLEVDPDATVADLGVAARQRVEILRALYRGARILVLDEPTAVLTPQESERLFGVLAGMAQAGMSIVLISHKLHELLAVTQRVTVLRDGRVVRTVTTGETRAAALAALMVGRETSLELDVPPARPSAEARLRVRGLVDRGGRLDPVDLEVHGGEIVGLAGVDGSGQAELTQALAGLIGVHAGTVELDGRDVTHAPIRVRRAAGLGYVPDDRSDEGLVLGLPLYENAALGRQRRPSLRRRLLLSPRRMRAHARRLVDAGDVRPRSVEALAGSLSGGNQQKLLMSRELADDPAVLIVSQPTRGVDIAASRAIHRELLAARAAGRGVLLNSLDLDEVKLLSDRIVVMCDGRVAGELGRDEVSDEALGLLMGGDAERVTAEATS